MGEYEKNNKNLKKLPEHLYKGGFGSTYYGADKIDVESLTDVRDFVSKNWKKSKKLLRYSSFGLSDIASEILGRKVSNGEIIAAMILEGYHYEPSVLNAVFYVDKDDVKKTQAMLDEKRKNKENGTTD